MEFLGPHQTHCSKYCSPNENTALLIPRVKLVQKISSFETVFKIKNSVYVVLCNFPHPTPTTTWNNIYFLSFEQTCWVERKNNSSPGMSRNWSGRQEYHWLQSKSTFQTTWQSPQKVLPFMIIIYVRGAQKTDDYLQNSYNNKSDSD